MVIEELKENFVELDTDVRAYIEQTKAYYELKTFKVLMKGTTSIIKMLLVGAAVLMALLLVAIAASIGVGQAMNNMFYGFSIMALCFVVIGIVIYLFRDKLDKPILKKYSEYYFDET